MNAFRHIFDTLSEQTLSWEIFPTPEQALALRDALAAIGEPMLPMFLDIRLPWLGLRLRVEQMEAST